MSNETLSSGEKVVAVLKNENEKKTVTAKGVKVEKKIIYAIKRGVKRCLIF